MPSLKRTASAQTSSFDKWLFAILGVAIVVISTAFDIYGKDVFRVPKELVFRGFAVVAAALLAAMALTGQLRGRLPATVLRRPMVWLPLLVVLWTAIATVFSTNIALSVDSLITVASGAVLFYSCWLAFSSPRSLALVNVAFAVAVINAVLALLQASKIWQPFTFPEEFGGRGSITGLVGNPNDLAGYLLVTGIAAVVGAATMSGRNRVLYSMTGIILFAALIATGARSVLIAYVAALVTAVTFMSRKAFALVAVIIILAGISLTTAKTEVGRRFLEAAEAAEARRFDILFAERLPAFLAAREMARDHPITGAGPGTFKWHYMTYRNALTHLYPEEWTRGWAANFREAHNDHLQIVAETGWPGYGVFVACVAALLMRRKSRGEGDVSRRQFSDSLRLPLVTAVGVVMLAQFPLQLAAPRFAIVFFAALIAARSET